jgi:hypothetical protein
MSLLIQLEKLGCFILESDGAQIFLPFDPNLGARIAGQLIKTADRKFTK